MALPTFESYERVHSKTGFSEILSELGLPQPETAFITNLAELRKIDRFPFVLKTAIGTASRGTWMIHNEAELEEAVIEIEGKPFGDVLLVQEAIDGPIEHAHGSRLDLLSECWRLASHSGPYAGSHEELTPLRWDWPSIVPTIFGALWSLANPGAAHTMPKTAWGAH